MRRPDPELPRWIDGAWEPGLASEPAAIAPWAQHGVGVFDTIAVRERRALDLDAHLARFARGCAAFDVVGPTREAWGDAVERIAGALESARGWVKIVAFRDGPRAAFGGAIPLEAVGSPCTAIILPWRRHAGDPLVGVKTTSWAAGALGLAEAARRGADEGIWLNQRGHVTEGCAANLFVVRGRKLFTASPRDGVVEGVVRAHVLAIARERGFAVHEGKLRLRRLFEADEVFLTSSIRGVRSVRAIDGRDVAGARKAPVATRFAEEVERRRRIRERDPDAAVDGVGAGG